MRSATAAVLTFACLLLLAGPAGAAKPVKGARYFGEDLGVASAALQVSKSGRSLSTSRRGSYVDYFGSDATCKVRFGSAKGARVRIRRNGKFSLRRRGRRALRLRGRFRSKDTASIKIRARCGRQTLVESFILHRKFKPRFTGCRSQKAKTVASSPTGRIFKQPRVVGFSYVPFTYGCLFSVNKRFLLGQDDDDETVGETDLLLFRLSGNYVGFADEATQVQGDNACDTRIRVVDLSTGKDARNIAIPFVPGFCRFATDLELKGNSSVAWITDLPEVWAADALGKRRLDAGGGIDQKSLSLSGSTVSWLNGGVRKSATLN